LGKSGEEEEEARGLGNLFYLSSGTPGRIVMT
jgi:hypothetical protein